ncbi:MAG TPA: STAS domain-containing protein [Streptomyces sp.]|nr:STAS domain-containing protein [Streptomyces sp.]
MTLQFSLRQGSLVVQLPPEVDIGNAEYVRTHLRDLARKRLRGSPRPVAETVVLDWSNAPFLTMAGVAAVEEFRSLAADAGVPVKIVTRRAVSRAVLRIVGIDELVPVYDTVDEALSSSNGDAARQATQRSSQPGAEPSAGPSAGPGSQPGSATGSERTEADGQSGEPSTA